MPTQGAEISSRGSHLAFGQRCAPSEVIRQLGVQSTIHVARRRACRLVFVEWERTGTDTLFWQDPDFVAGHVAKVIKVSLHVRGSQQQPGI